MEFFAVKSAKGVYNLTTAGYVGLAAVIILLLLGAAFLNRKRERKRMDTQQLVFSAIAVALATVTSMIKIFDMPFGGAVTLLSMMFIGLIGYWYGLSTGLMTGVAYGVLQLVIDPFIISLPQMILDYFLAFGALGLSGLFSKKANGLIPGYLVGVFGRFVFSTMSGVIFFASYADAYHMNPLVYSAAYNGAYMGAEAAITIIILALPPVAKGLRHVKNMVNTRTSS